MATGHTDTPMRRLLRENRVNSQLLRGGLRAGTLRLFHESFHKSEICFGFCKFAHICIGCGGSKPHDDCMCLSSKIPWVTSFPSAEKVKEDSLPSVVSPGSRRVFLLASEIIFESDSKGSPGEAAAGRRVFHIFSSGVLGPYAHWRFLLTVLDLFDYFRQGVFDMVHVVPSAATWSRSRNSGFPDQRPLRSRSSPFGLSALNPKENTKITAPNPDAGISGRVRRTLHRLFLTIEKTEEVTTKTVLLRCGPCESFSF